MKHGVFHKVCFIPCFKRGVSYHVSYVVFHTCVAYVVVLDFRPMARFVFGSCFIPNASSQPRSVSDPRSQPDSNQ